MGAEAKTGVETVTQFVEAWCQQGANMELGEGEGDSQGGGVYTWQTDVRQL